MGSTLISFDMVPKKNLPRNWEAEALADLRSSILVFDVPIVEECAVLRIVLGGGIFVGVELIGGTYVGRLGGVSSGFGGSSAAVGVIDGEDGGDGSNGGGGSDGFGSWGPVGKDGPANERSFVLCPPKNFLPYNL